MFHHVTPMAGRITHAQKDRFVLAAGLVERFLSPGIPIDRVGSVLEKIRTFLPRKTIGFTRNHRGIFICLNDVAFRSHTGNGREHYAQNPETEMGHPHSGAVMNCIIPQGIQTDEFYSERVLPPLTVPLWIASHTAMTWRTTNHWNVLRRVL